MQIRFGQAGPEILHGNHHCIVTINMPPKGEKAKIKGKSDFLAIPNETATKKEKKKKKSPSNMDDKSLEDAIYIALKEIYSPPNTSGQIINHSTPKPENKDEKSEVKSSDEEDMEFMEYKAIKDRGMDPILVKTIMTVMKGQQVRDVIVESVSKYMEERTNAEEQRVSDLEDRLAKQDKLLTSQTTIISRLTEKSEQQERNTKVMTLKITGIEEREDENTIETVGKFAGNMLNLNIPHNAIASAIRMGSTPKKPSEGEAQDQDSTPDIVKPRDILVDFASYSAKSSVYSARTKLRKLIGGNGKFINEFLSKEQAKLFMETRKSINRREKETCWTLNGIIFAKKNGGEPIKIDSMHILKRHFKLRDPTTY